jgi:hypothetical protein
MLIGPAKAAIGKVATATSRVFEMAFIIDIAFSMELAGSGGAARGKTKPWKERNSPGFQYQEFCRSAWSMR